MSRELRISQCDAWWWWTAVLGCFLAHFHDLPEECLSEWRSAALQTSEAIRENLPCLKALTHCKMKAIRIFACLGGTPKQFTQPKDRRQAPNFFVHWSDFSDQSLKYEHLLIRKLSFLLHNSSQLFNWCTASLPLSSKIYFKEICTRGLCMCWIF